MLWWCNLHDMIAWLSRSPKNQKIMAFKYQRFWR